MCRRVKGENIFFIVVLFQVEHDCSTLKDSEIIARVVDEDGDAPIGVHFDEPWFLVERSDDRRQLRYDSNGKYNGYLLFTFCDVNSMKTGAGTNKISDHRSPFLFFVAHL
jgi:hypothetical protein